MEEIGSCNAVIASMATKVDGSFKLTIEINPQNQKIVSEIMRLWGLNKKLVQIGLISIDPDEFYDSESE